MDIFIPDSCPNFRGWCKRKLEYLENNSTHSDISDICSEVLKEQSHRTDPPSWVESEEFYVVISDTVEQKNPGSTCHLCQCKLSMSFNPILESWVFTECLSYGDSVVVHCKCFECMFGSRLRKMSF